MKMKFSLSLYLFSDKIVCKSADGWQKVQRTLNFSPATPPFLAAALATRMSTDIVWLICANFLHKNTITAAVEKKSWKKGNPSAPFYHTIFATHRPVPHLHFTFLFFFCRCCWTYFRSLFVWTSVCVCVCLAYFFYFTLHRFCIIFQGRQQSAAGVAYISICPTGDAARSEREGQNSWSWPFVQPTRWVSVCLSRRPEEKLLPQFCTVRWPIKLHSRCHYFLVYSQNGHWLTGWNLMLQMVEQYKSLNIQTNLCKQNISSISEKYTYCVICC